jgi:hypothetical protein
MELCDNHVPFVARLWHSVGVGRKHVLPSASQQQQQQYHSSQFQANEMHSDTLHLFLAGKSTVLRAICAVALLGSCGLMAPAQRAVVPFLDFIMLRNFSGDSPLEGRSAFAMEMAEITCACRNGVACGLMHAWQSRMASAVYARYLLLPWPQRVSQRSACCTLMLD